MDENESIVIVILVNSNPKQNHGHLCPHRSENLEHVYYCPAFQYQDYVMLFVWIYEVIKWNCGTCNLWIKQVQLFSAQVNIVDEYPLLQA